MRLRLSSFHRFLAIATRPVLRKPLQFTIPVFAHPPIHSITRAHSLMSEDMKRFDESFTTVRINDKDDGEQFVCDEEPHMLTPEQGYGFYPITLGLLLHDGKLEIVRKLGWASSSSVWLARSVGNAYPLQYVAVKVLTVDATAGIVKGFLGEADILKTIKKANPDHPGFKHCLQLYDVFLAQSHHGPHICFVTKVLGESLISLRRLQPNGHGAFPVALSKQIIKQTLLALDYLHRECDIVHTDVKPDNCLVSIEYTDEAIARFLENSPSAMYEPRIEPDLSPDPIITVKSQPLPNLGHKPDASNLNICLIDYGHATPTKKHFEEQVQPVLLRAPEVILGHPWSTPIDIWSLGCLAFEYLTGAALIRLHESSSVSLDDVHLERIIEIVGPFPPNFLQACPRAPEFFDEKGALIRIKKLFPGTVEDCLRIYKTMDENDIPPAAAFIRKCLTIDPSARPSALDLLDDEWLKVA